MRRYHRLTLGERYQIEALLNSGFSLRQIARQLSRSPSTISREVGRMDSYDALSCHKAAEVLWRTPHPELRIIHVQLETYIREQLTIDWSPEEISKRLQQEQGQSVVSHQTIYRYLERDKAAGGSLWKHLRILRKQRKDRKKPHWRPFQPFADRVRICDRPQEIENRGRLGDVERDTLLGKHNGSLLLTIVDRTSRLLKMKWLPDKSSERIHRATVALLKNEPIKTITNDNGSEFSRHQKTAKALDAQVYFAHSYAAWQRGTNENTNGLIRQYFPRKKDIGKPSPKQIQHVEDLLNNRPRKCLGYKTPNEVHQQLKQQISPS